MSYKNGNELDVIRINMIKREKNWIHSIEIDNRNGFHSTEWIKMATFLSDESNECKKIVMAFNSVQVFENSIERDGKKQKIGWNRN